VSVPHSRAREREGGRIVGQKTLRLERRLRLTLQCGKLAAMRPVMLQGSLADHWRITGQGPDKYRPNIGRVLDNYWTSTG
jgi:hypothetical protein